MGFYNACFGVNSNSKILLRILNLTTEECGRFRDCYLKDGKIVIYTRNGGGNREFHRHIMDKLSQHPNYIRDYDDDFDSTYAYIEFSVSKEEVSEHIKDMKSEEYTPTEKFQRLISSMDKNRRRD